MTLITLLKSENDAFPCPSVYSCISQEINSRASRNVMGTLIKSRLCIKKQITVEWHAVDRVAKNFIIARTADNTFSLTYYDTETDTVKTGTFYRGNDYTLEPRVSKDPAGTGFLRYDVKMTLVEC